MQIFFIQMKNQARTDLIEEVRTFFKEYLYLEPSQKAAK